MTNDELRELNRKRKIHQIAWVTRDLEKSMKAWVENLKVGPWTVLTFTEKTLNYLDVDGKRVTEPFKFLIGIISVVCKESSDCRLESLSNVDSNSLFFVQHQEDNFEPFLD